MRDQREFHFFRNRPALATAGWILLAGLVLAPCFGRAQETTNKGFYLPKNAVAAGYYLSRLSNRELMDAPRSEFVYVALLQRKGLDKKYRIEALDGLAK